MTALFEFAKASWKLISISISKMPGKLDVALPKNMVIGAGDGAKLAEINYSQ